MFIYTFILLVFICFNC